MKKRIFSTLLALCMLLCLMPTAAFAEDSTETPPVCSCETACTAESMNTDCPVCGAEGALPENCAECAQPADDAAAQPEGEVSDPQPETALTALSGEGATPAAGETVKDVRTADELTAAIADSTVNTVKLAGDISISSSLTVTRTVTLDLNGHVLQMTGNDRDPVIEVKKNSSGVGIGNLTLIDSAPNTAHKFTPNADGLWVLNEENGTKTVNGGVITGSKEIGIWVEGVHDPHLTQKPAVGCAAAAGGGVFAGFYAYFTMTGGSIRGCAAVAGGGVCLTNSSSFAMGGNALIADCISTDGGSCGGGGIFVSTSGGKVSLSGSAKIKNCRTVKRDRVDFPNVTGGGVHVSSGSFEMSGGSIESCTAVNGGDSVFVCTGGNGKFTMTGGTVDGSITMPYTVGNNPVYMDGLGTAVSPYQIGTADQLKLFRDIVNGAGGQTQNRGAYAMLTADIDLNNEPWTPIGPDRDSAYTGTFDGQGHTVKNLSVTVNVQPGRAGLFGCVKDGTIRKLTVAGSVSCTANQGWCGGIAGYAMDETIENCASLCTVSCTGIDARVGGIVGLVDYNSRTLIIRDCYNIGKITGRSDNGSGDAGGICGFYMNGKISNCYNVGEITGSGYVSKIAVSAYNDSRPTNCYYLSDTDTDFNGTAKTAAEFANGDVLDELKAGRNDSPWDSCQYVAAAKITLPVFKGQGDEHTHNGNWTSNGNGKHSRRCPCNVVETQNCSGGTATCTEKAKCAVCGAEYGDVLGHDFTTSWTHDDNEHWKQCSRCDAKDDVSPHTWDSGTITTAPTCTKAGEKTYSCTKCGATKIEPIPATGHSWKSEWASDATHHWHECANKNCDVTDNAGKDGYAEHSGGTATCTEKAVCTHCGQSYGETNPVNHTGTEQWTQTTTTHEKRWNCCNTVSVPNENHEWADGVCSECGYVCLHEDTDKNHICDICGKTTSEHKDADNNHICDYCNKKISDHSGGKATCIAKAVCEICKESYGSLDLNNHADLKHIDAKGATAAEEGNIEYWYCGGCKKYFSDAAAKIEITEAATVTAKLPPRITAGDGATVTQGEKKELSFTSDASFADFLRVELDGTALEEKNYTKREGSTIITLNRDFVATLSVGEHTLAIISQHGTATAKFTVKAKPAETATTQPTVTPQPTAQPQPTVQPVSPIPRTGDTANPALWFALLIVSGSALAAIFVLRRKDNRK